MTNKQLLEFGMKENVGDFVYPMSKILAKGEDGTLWLQEPNDYMKASKDPNHTSHQLHQASIAVCTIHLSLLLSSRALP